MFKSGTLAGVALGFPHTPTYSGAEFDGRARGILDQYPIRDNKHHQPGAHRARGLSLANAARESMSALRRLDEALHSPTSFVVVLVSAAAT